MLPTPTEAGKLELRIAISLQFEKTSKVHPALGILPKNTAMKILTNKSLKAYMHDVSQDFDVWQHKVYMHPPILAQGDGPVIPYRKWARQFYTEYEQEKDEKRGTMIVGG